MISYYYGLPIHLSYSAGGHFWWYYYEDCLPYRTKPFWQALPEVLLVRVGGHRKGQRSIFAKKDNLRRSEAEALAEKAWTAHNSRLGEGYDISSA